MMRMKRLSRSSLPTGPNIARPAGLHLVIDQHSSVLVETDIAAVRPALLFPGPHDDAFDDVALFHVRPGDGVLYCGDENVPYGGIASASNPRAP